MARSLSVLGSLRAGCVLIFAVLSLFWVQSVVQQNPASGGYQLFEPSAFANIADNPLNAIEKFSASLENAPECCNAPNTGVPCCFVAGTPVKTPDGYKNIEELVVGDEVLSQNIETGAIEANAVTDTFVRPISEIKTFYKLKIGSSEKSEDLFVTGEHPFWVTDLEEWVTVDDLQVGALLTNHQGEELTVQAKVLETELQQTFNITVAGNNNYFAGELETLVHNCSANQIRQQIAKGQAPSSVKRIDTAEASVPGSQDHIEFSDGRALNKDGTWRHGTGGGSGTGTLTNKEKKWLESIGWTIPE